ncbi:hypothetical protein FDECE_3946 [Fusarium decemcellulare]|nr:hypothetical protein FDECE_3946 [Fusarium decemcellulare]
MAPPRRSARIRNIRTEGSSEPLDPAPAEPRTSSSIDHHDTQPKPPAPDDALSVLPAEILKTILDNILDAPAIVKLACTSKRYYSITMPVLHKRIAMKVNFSEHMPYLIRRLEPLLSITQKKQLKKKGKYGGQQPRFSKLLDPDVVPACASYVREIIIGNVSPGWKHKNIVLNYWEQVLMNVDNLEVFSTTELTKLMAERIALKKNLKSLQLKPDTDWESEITVPLAELSDLEHLSVQDRNCDGTVTNDENVLQSILLNSLSTLQSLDIRTGRYFSDFMADWEDQMKARNPDAMKQAHDFSALKSLTLWGIQFHGSLSERVMPNLTRAIDFLKLTELNLSHLTEGKLAFFKYLEDLFGSADKTDIHLRKLSLQMYDDESEQDYQLTELQLEGVYRFICSFETLTSLEFFNYNRHTSVVETNFGLSERIQQAILKHKDLELLRFNYSGSGGYNSRIPDVPAETVAILTKNLPRLREFEFPPQGTDLDAMSRALSHAKNLMTLTCDPDTKINDWSEWDPPLTFVKTILEGLLDYADNAGDFVWEGHYKLKRMTVGWRCWLGIGSDLKPRKDVTNLVTISKGDRMVMHQSLPIGPFMAFHPYKASSKWADRVNGSMC